MPENKKQRVLIIGAGLTGLSLGVQLLTHASAYYEPVIFEKASSLEDITKSGFVINLSPNAIHILRGLNFDLAREGAGMPLNRTVLHHASKPETIIAEAENLFPDPHTLQTVERGPLQLLLLQRYSLLRGEIYYNRDFQSYKTLDDGSVEAAFASGEAVSGEYMIGADGVYSGVRKAVYGNLVGKVGRPSRCPFSTIFPFSLLTPVIALLRPKRKAWECSPTHWTALYGITRQLPAQLLTVHGNDGGLGTMHWFLRDVPGAYTTYSLQQGRVFWICYQPSAPSSTGRGRYTDKEALETMKLYSNCPYTASTEKCTLPAVNFSEITSRSERFMKVRINHTFFRNISDGNVLLIGDAAHPMNTFHGQGAAMGIEEALVLCNSLLRGAWAEDADVDPELVGIKYFENQRIERSERVTDLGFWFGAAVMGDLWILRKIRDWVIRRVLRKEDPEAKAERAKAKAKNALKKKEDEQEDGDEEKVKNVPEKKKKAEGHWLFDLKVDVQTEEEFWESVKE
ncbi:FAD/NAD(P)-binding domain-containing protein [Choiromyces venosus 120613-1]|uniref:FAD/NAD(P)-binding domain-containing protein n=1 Tax=Choiromyces venosus 120613-1 TaxID=1336337 RepID=A0A3N4K3B5_9PEZI|nr:FAD/NAD(P)-binding domain-containing protein [Choiromyces venosus 120613-1]